MTHLSNYGNDRLALIVFDSLTKYLQCWTNLKLSSEHPTDLAERYFSMYPEEVDPIWQVSFWQVTTYPVHAENWNCTDSGVQFQLGEGEGEGAALESSCQTREFVGGGRGRFLVLGHPAQKILKSRGSEMVFSMFSKKTQPGYAVIRQVLLVLTACTCTAPAPQKKVQGGLGAKS